MQLFNSENENRDYIVERAKIKINDTIEDEHFIDTEVPVPYKHIYLPTPHTPTLEIWCFKQDICLYSKLFDKKVKYKGASIFEPSNQSEEILKIVLEKDSSQNSHHIGLPHVIIETKMGKSITTDNLLAYSQKVEMIKTVFPYVQYILLFFGKPPARAYRHGVNFDSIEYIEDLTEDSIDKVIMTILNLYKKSMNEVRKII